MKRFIDDNNILWRYLEIASSSIEGSVRKDGRIINFKCNVCGDGIGKKRGHLIWEKRSDFIYYKCFNFGDCPVAGEGNAISAKKWLRQYFPVFYKQYLREILTPIEEKNLSKKVVVFEDFKKEKEEEFRKEEVNDTKYFKPLINSEGEIFKNALDYCLRRKIPREVFNKFYVSTDGKYRNRLIIPFYTKDKTINFFQARDLIGNTPKYLNRKINKENILYNIDFVNKEKEIISVEGPIDSMFIENSIATMGVSFSKEIKKYLETMNVVYLFDNDKAGRKASKEFLKKGKKVFNWFLYLKDNNIKMEIKDINDLYIYLERKRKFSYEEWEKYFTNSYFDLVYFS